MPCLDQNMLNNYNGPAEIARAIELIGSPPGLEPPPFVSNKEQARVGETSNVHHDYSLDNGDVREKLKAFLAKSTDEALAMNMMQQARWNVACACAHQQALYVQHAQACMQLKRCKDMQTMAQTSPSVAPTVPQGNQGLGVRVQPQQHFISCSDLNTCKNHDVPRRPPGVWNKPVRTSSWSSDASTRASSNGEAKSCTNYSPSRSAPTSCSKQLQIEIPTSSSFCRGGKRVCWTVDARKLRSCDLHIVSPGFELFPGSEFKLMIKSAATGGKRGRAGFRAAGGRGIVEFKCVTGSSTDRPPLTFRISLNDPGGKLQGRTIVTHNFQHETMYCSQDSQSWDFDAAVDDVSKMFVVCLEVAPVE